MQIHRRRTAVIAALIAATGLGAARATSAQSVLFDFNNAPIHTSLPITLTVGGITAHFSATAEGMSIQDSSAPVFPIGFSGRYIYPNSINKSDLIVDFDQVLTDFSILYSPQELACDDSATMRVTAYMSGSLVGTNTKTTNHPGTWPVDTLACSFPQGFNGVVVHYDKTPPTCTDIGVIFLADDMRVTPMPVLTWSNLGSGLAGVSGVPSLVGTGTLVAGTAAALNLSNARPSTQCEMLVSFAAASVPFKGGVLIAFPPIVSFPDVSLPNGTLPLPFTWPAGVPSGMSMWFQYLVSDAAAVQKVALSNAIKAITP